MKLNKGEIICPECKGRCITELEYIKFSDTNTKHTIPYKKCCFKCNGEGKIDWIENLIKKSSISYTNIYRLWNNTNYDIDIGHNDIVSPNHPFVCVCDSLENLICYLKTTEELNLLENLLFENKLEIIQSCFVL